MNFLPMAKVWDRINIAKGDSDTSLFYNLLYLGEMTTKIISAGLVAAIADDRERLRYRQVSNLIHADGLGEWSASLEEVLKGPTSQLLATEAYDAKRELTQKLTAGNWQYESVKLLHYCATLIDPRAENLSTKIDGLRWFSLFTYVRNKTRGHGATQSSVLSKMCPAIEESIKLIEENFSLFQQQWVFLHRNLSGKYRVTQLAEKSSDFDYLKGSNSEKFENGIYIYFGRPRRVELIESNADATDFFFPNGQNNGKRYELISYITGEKTEGDVGPYLTPTGTLPASETQGIGNLEIQGDCFSNLPAAPSGYIHREGLEKELFDTLMDDRRSIVTLVGRGGIGKTSLALTVLNRVAQEARFLVILWFSSRDIDLLAEGPKLVQPHVTTEKDIADEYVRLVEANPGKVKGFDNLKCLGEALCRSPFNGPILLIFDNFETVKNPTELFVWVDTYIRNPNKILITTRLRDFKGDYPVEVAGMSEQEANALIDSTASDLGISDLLTSEYRRGLCTESDGHPYVIKILLGEVAKAKSLIKPERIVATQDDILNALFERTYAGLSPVGKRVFLTLSSWRSVVPQLALEAALLRTNNERMDVTGAVEELRRSSLIDVSVSPQDNTDFLSVPLVASIFGKKKLAVSQLKSAIAADTEWLYIFGAAQSSDVKHGVGPRVQRMFRQIAYKLASGQGKIESYIPILEFVATKYHRAWLLLADLYEESQLPNRLEKATEATRRYLEAPDGGDVNDIWRRLADLCKRSGDVTSEAQALVEMSQLDHVPFYTLSYVANELNKLFSEQPNIFDSDEKQLMIKPLVQVMEKRFAEADATDCSRLAWLCLKLKDGKLAKHYAQKGLGMDPSNIHCQNLLIQLET